MEHHRLPSPVHPLPPWFWRLWLLGLVLAVALSLSAWRWPYLPGDVAVARAVQSIDLPALGWVLNELNDFGGGTPAVALTTLVVIGFLFVRRFDFFAVFVVATVLRGSATVLKRLTDRPRPAAPLVKVMEHSADSSFPSGHVTSAVLFYGLLAVLVELTSLPKMIRRGIQSVCLAVVLLMGPARIYAGAHWPSDVLGGYLWGTLLLAALVGSACALGLLHVPSAMRASRRSVAAEETNGS